MTKENKDFDKREEAKKFMSTITSTTGMKIEEILDQFYEFVRDHELEKTLNTLKQLQERKRIENQRKAQTAERNYIKMYAEEMENRVKIVEAEKTLGIHRDQMNKELETVAEGIIMDVMRVLKTNIPTIEGQETINGAIREYVELMENKIKDTYNIKTEEDEKNDQVSQH